MAATTHPRERCMIFKTGRTLEDGCGACNGSEVWCDSLADTGRRCCGLCSHRPAPTATHDTTTD